MAARQRPLRRHREMETRVPQSRRVVTLRDPVSVEQVNRMALSPVRARNQVLSVSNGDQTSLRGAVRLGARGREAIVSER
jgi:hypothetical protein